jgi:methylthioribose-1-phosphate isomerase
MRGAMLQTLEWTGTSLRLLDQTRLPAETVYVDLTDERQVWDAIKRLVVRGAPAIGVTAAYGAYMGIKDAPGNAQDVVLRLDQVCDYLASARPTAVNLFWALDRVKRAVRLPPGTPGGGWGEGSGDDVKQKVLAEAIAIHEQDQDFCGRMGEHALQLLLKLEHRDPIHLLTHCNAGALATSGIGSALSPIYVGCQRGLKFRVWADETRPLLQGSRITAYELSQCGGNVEVTVQCDNMAASLMSQGQIDAILVGADRIAANGDTANKIGTHGLAIIAKHFGVPLFVLAPSSTIDLSITEGSKIPIEHRDAREVTHPHGIQSAPAGVGVYNPAFDVTPYELITEIVTENGVWTPRP